MSDDSATSPPTPPPPSRPRSQTTFAIMLDNFLDKYVQSVLDGVAAFTNKNGIQLICATVSAGDAVSPLRELIGPANVDGLLILGSWLTNVQGDAAAVARFMERYAPLPSVSIAESSAGIHSVSADNRAGMSNLVKHLVGLHGYRTLAFIGGPQTNQDAQERLAAFQEVLGSSNIPLDPALVAHGNWSVASGASCTRKLLETHAGQFQAIVCANDAMATGAIDALHARGLMSPGDIAVTGFDNIGESGYELTTVNQPTFDLGRRAAGVLWDLCRNKPAELRQTLVAEVVLRQTCGCAGSKLVPAVRTGAAASDTEEESPLVEQREAILLAMGHALGNVHGVKTPDWLGKLYDSFAMDVMAGPAGRFKSALESLLATQITESAHVNTWNSAIAVLRGGLERRMSQPEVQIVAQSLWRQAELVIDTAARRFRAGLTGSKMMRAIAEKHAQKAPGSIEDLADKFTEKLLALGIERCYAVIFGERQPVPETARVFLAFDQDVTAMDENPESYPSTQLIPDDLLAKPFTTLVAMPLNKGDRHIGLVFFERGDADGFILESLRWQLSEQLWKTLGGL